MPNVADRLALLLEVHGDSYRSAAELCGLDHTTLMRIGRGETENSVSIQRIADAYGVPVHWMRGEPDIGTDFAFAVLSRPVQERIMFLWERERRAAYGLEFLLMYAPQRYTVRHLAELVRVPESEMEVILAGGHGAVDRCNVEHLCAETGLPVQWFQTGLLGCEDQEELLVRMATQALTALAEAVGANVTRAEIEAAANALI